MFESNLKTGVNDGARTRDIPDHNRMLYQLSYIHHVVFRTGEVYQPSLGVSSIFKLEAKLAAIRLISTLSGPGGVTNTVFR